MKKSFISKVLVLDTVDTKKYRYRVIGHPDQINHPSARRVIRLPLDQLDTTAALDGWETVANVYPNPCGVLIEFAH